MLKFCHKTFIYNTFTLVKLIIFIKLFDLNVKLDPHYKTMLQFNPLNFFQETICWQDPWIECVLHYWFKYKFKVWLVTEKKWPKTFKINIDWGQHS